MKGERQDQLQLGDLGGISLDRLLQVAPRTPLGEVRNLRQINSLAGILLMDGRNFPQAFIEIRDLLDHSGGDQDLVGDLPTAEVYALERSAPLSDVFEDPECCGKTLILTEAGRPTAIIRTEEILAGMLRQVSVLHERDHWLRRQITEMQAGLDNLCHGLGRNLQRLENLLAPLADEKASMTLAMLQRQTGILASGLHPADDQDGTVNLRSLMEEEQSLVQQIAAWYGSCCQWESLPAGTLTRGAGLWRSMLFALLEYVLRQGGQGLKLSCGAVETEQGWLQGHINVEGGGCSVLAAAWISGSGPGWQEPCLMTARRDFLRAGGRLAATRDGGRLQFQMQWPAFAADPRKTPGEQLIFLVDDDPDILSVLSAELRDLGHRVAVAANGALALDYVKTECPDLVLTDLRMPDMDGLQLVSRIREERPGLPVWIFSGKVDTWEGKRLASNAGAAGFLPKPCEYEHLKQVLCGGQGAV